MMKFRYTEYTQSAITKEYNVTQEILDEYEITAEQLEEFLRDPDEAEDDVCDAVREMLWELEYEIYSEDERFDDEQFDLVEDED